MATWKRPQDWVLLVGGVYLFLTPWLFGFAGEAAAGNAWTVGVVLALASIWGLAQPAQVAAPAVSLVAGLWLAISPWALGFAGAVAAATNAWVVGVLAVVLAATVLAGIRRQRTPTRQSA